MKKIIIFLIILYLPFYAKASTAKIEWEKIWDQNGEVDTLNNVIKTKDNDYIVIGKSNSTDINNVTNKGESDVIILKYDEDWNLIWAKNWGGNGGEYFYNIIQTKDDGFLAVVESSSTDIDNFINGGSSDAFIIKFDKDWNIEWQKNWGGDRTDYFSFAFETYDECYIAFGRSQSKNLESISKFDAYYDAIIVKYDKDGNILWEKKWGGTRHEKFSDVIQTKEKGYIAVGQTNSRDLEGIPNDGQYVSVIVEFDKDGNILAERTWEPLGDGSQSEFLDIIETYDGNYILAARDDSTNLENITNKGEEDIIIVKYDENWNLLWQKNWGGNLDDIPSELIQMNDGGFVLVGKSLSTDIEGLTNIGDNDGVIIKFDKNGNVLCEQNHGGKGPDVFKTIIQIDDKSLIAINSLDVSSLEEIGEHTGMYSAIIKYSFQYDMENVTTNNGTTEISQQGNLGVINTQPNKGFEVDEIVIKDKEGNVLDVEITKQEDGTYSFELYTDVSVEVIYKESIDNPKTGILDVMTILFIGFIISITGIFVVKRYNERLEF